MSPIFQAVPFPFHKPEAQQLLMTLVQAQPTARAAMALAQDVGLNVGFLNPDQPPYFVWRDVLLQAAVSGLSRQVVQAFHDRLLPSSPQRPFLAALLADQPAPIDPEPRGADGQPNFVSGTDDVSTPEALLYYDDLMIQIGRVPTLIGTLQGLVRRAPSVCRLVVDFNGPVKHGTAFRVGPDLLLTNWHVLHNTLTGAVCSAVTAEFGYEQDEAGVSRAATPVPCDAGSIVTEKKHDWAVVRAAKPLEDGWPVLKLSEAADPVRNSAAYIIQHPNGLHKRLGFVRNQVTDFDADVVHYLTDTQEGSSGAPVFDAAGRLIALHHAGGRPQEVVGKPPVKKNEGVRIPRVVAGLKAAGVAVP